MRGVLQPNDDVCLAVNQAPEAVTAPWVSAGGRRGGVWILTNESLGPETQSFDGVDGPGATGARGATQEDPRTLQIQVPCGWRLRGRLRRVFLALLPTAMAIAFDVTAQAVQREDATSPAVIWGINARNEMEGQGDRMGRQPWRLVTSSFVSYGLAPMLVNASCTFVFCYFAGLWYGCGPVLASMSANALKSALYPRTAHVGANERSIAAIVHANLVMRNEPLAPFARLAFTVFTVAYAVGVALMGVLDTTGDLGLLYAAAVAYGFGKFDVRRAAHDRAGAMRSLSASLLWWMFPFVLLALNAKLGYTFVAPPWVRLELRGLTKEAPVAGPAPAPAPFPPPMRI